MPSRPPLVNIPLQTCLGICDWNSGMVMMSESEHMSNVMKSALQARSTAIESDFSTYLDEQALFPKLLLLKPVVDGDLGLKGLQLISEFIECHPKNWFQFIKNASLVIDDGNVYLGLNGSPGGSNTVQLKERICLKDGRLEGGKIQIIYPLGSFNNFILNGTHIQRPKSDLFLWNPLVWECSIDSWTESLRLSPAVNSVSLSVDCHGFQSATILIKFNSEPVKFSLKPDNLAHSARIKAGNCIYWRIERVSPGSTYTLHFDSIKAVHLQLTAKVEGTLQSQFKIASIQIDGQEIDCTNLARVTYATEIKETLAM